MARSSASYILASSIAPWAVAPSWLSCKCQLGTGAWGLGAMTYGTEMCYLSSISCGADSLDSKGHIVFRKLKCENLSLKGLKG